MLDFNFMSTKLKISETKKEGRVVFGESVNKGCRYHKHR